MDVAWFQLYDLRERYYTIEIRWMTAFDGEELMNYKIFFFFCKKLDGTVAQSLLLSWEFPFKMWLIGKTSWFLNKE